jgi:putative peptide maturation dehydrogenase
VRIKRSRFVFAHLRTDDNPLIEALLALVPGETRSPALSPMRAISLPARGSYPVDETDLKLLCRTPPDEWIEASDLARAQEVSPERIARLARLGLLIADSDDERLAELRRREEVLREQGWDPYGALFHFMSQWSKANLSLPSEVDELARFMALGTSSRYRELVEKHGPPPSHFHHRSDAVGTIELPVAEADSAFLRTLARRRTVREFDARTPLTLRELGSILFYVFGCQGSASMPDGELVILKRTSPSGGGLHPTEAYPLVIDVEGLAPGIYHYDVEHHGLETLAEMDRKEVRRLADDFTAGQSFPRHAHALVVLTTRFYRNYWKYRVHRRSYGVLLMDAAHLSQTFYLVCAELGLGAFVTGFINSRAIEDGLGLDGFEEGPLAVCGCGRPSPDPAGLDPQFRPRRPRR